MKKDHITLDLSETAWESRGHQLPRGIIQHVFPTTYRDGGKHRKITRRTTPLFPEFGEPRDASSALPDLLSPRKSDATRTSLFT